MPTAMVWLEATGAKQRIDEAATPRGLFARLVRDALRISRFALRSCFSPASDSSPSILRTQELHRYFGAVRGQICEANLVG
jgi:hypothetical protein